MKTIFIVITWFHPAYKAGGPVQSIVNLVDQYDHEQVNFKIFCSSTDLDGTVNTGVKFDQWCQYNQKTQVWYASKNKRSIRTIRNEIKNSHTDVLFIIGIYSWYFNLVPLLFCAAPLKIISVRGMLHPGALSQKPLKKKIYLAFWKLAGIPRRYSFHATDVKESEFILKMFGDKVQVFIAGNFPRVFHLYSVLQKKTGILQMVSIALISPMKNILMVLKALQHCSGQIQYDIYGPVKDERYWQQCLGVIADLPSNILINYHGHIEPVKVREALEKSQLFVLPSESENFGHAIYEALSAGKPVITSHNTPWNGLEKTGAGKNVNINIEAIASAINYYTQLNDFEYKQGSEAAVTYAGNVVDFEHVKEQYIKMFN